MAEIKTQANDADVEAFLAAVPDEKRRADSLELLALMKRVTGADPVMWGTRHHRLRLAALPGQEQRGRVADRRLLSAQGGPHDLRRLQRLRPADPLFDSLGKHTVGQGLPLPEAPLRRGPRRARDPHPQAPGPPRRSPAPAPSTSRLRGWNSGSTRRGAPARTVALGSRDEQAARPHLNDGPASSRRVLESDLSLSYCALRRAVMVAVVLDDHAGVAIDAGPRGR